MSGPSIASPAVSTATTVSSMDLVKECGTGPSAVHAVRKVNVLALRLLIVPLWDRRRCCVIGISIYQERKTEHALAALRDLSSPRALVIRDGERVRVAGRDVVRGDQAVLAEGDRVPADGVLLECVNFSVDESALTGESVPVRKTPVEAASVSAEMGRPGGDATPWVSPARSWSRATAWRW